MKNRPAVVISSFVVWLLLFAGSLIALYTTEPTADGFTRGPDRVSSFLLWQFFAVLAALATLVAGFDRQKIHARLRWLSRTPIFGEMFLVIFVLGLFGYFALTANLQDTSPTRSPAIDDLAPPAGTPIESFAGIYRGGLEASYFYSMDGGGPWWMETNAESRETLNALRASEPGRSQAFAALTLEGWISESKPNAAIAGEIEGTLHAVSIESLRQLSSEEFDYIHQDIAE